MKKTFTSIFFLVAVLFSTTQVTYAQYIVECPLCSKLQTQIPEFAEAIITAGASLSTQVNTYATFVKTVIQGPLQDALTAIAIANSVNNVKNLIQGGLGNQQLIKTSPSIYIGNKEKGAIAVNLNTVRQADGAYSNSILNAVTGIYKNNDLETQLSSLSASSLPSIIQKNACTDTALTARAREDSLNNNGTVDNDAFNARKTQLYNTFCLGDPSKDPKLAQVLNTANEQDSSLCGTECFLRKISGDNPYARGQKVAILIAKNGQEEKQAAIDDLKSGGGIASQSVCPPGKRATTDAQGKPYANADQAPCTVPETVLTPSSVLSDQYKKAISSGDDTLKSTFGTGGISGLLASILGGINTFSRALNGGISFNITGSTLSGSGTGGSGGDSTYEENLKGDGRTKSTITSPMSRALNSHASSLTDLTTTDSNYVKALDIYSGQLDEVKGCYDSLSSPRDPRVAASSPQDPRAAAYMSFYQNKKSALDSTRSTIVTEQSLIGTTRNLISTTISKITASNSSEAISDIFNNYQNQVDTQNLPTQTTEPRRGGDYQIFVGAAQQDNLTGGVITTFRTQCQNIRAEQGNSSYSGENGGI